MAYTIDDNSEEETRALDSYPPTEGMIEEAQRGLDWRNEYGRGGTEIGIARARDIVNEKNLPIDTWRRIKAYFDRHQSDREAEGWSPGEDGYPSNGRIAWALWGGDAGWNRSQSIMEDVSNDQETVRSEMEDIETGVAIEEELSAPKVRYAMLEAEQRRINGREVEYRTMEVGGLELRDEHTSGSRVFSGYAAVFNSPSEPLPFTETIAPGAFRRTLKSEREIRMFVNHDSGQPLATTRNGSLRLSEDARGLRAEADLPDTTAGRDLATLIESGVVHSMSFGFSIPRGGDSFSDNGQTREIREAILHEVSVITGWPAYKATSGVTVRNTEEIAVEEAADRGLPVALAQRIFDLNSKR
jgi:HK97 family phage prohead protease